MYNSTKSKQEELLNTQLNTDKDHNSQSNTELVFRQKIERTPFWVVGQPDKGYFGTYGKYQITERYKTPQEVENYIDENEWDVMIKITAIVTSIIIEEKERDKMELMRKKFTEHKEQKEHELTSSAGNGL